METVFVGTYTTEPGSTVPTASGGVYAAAFDPSTGALGVAKVAAALQSPTVRCCVMMDSLPLLTVY
jgi:hypothetical protein